jgi:hypothetical protein
MEPTSESQSTRSDREEIERYRLAAEEALDQLDWCIEYLHRLRRSDIANSLARNRHTIRTRMRDPNA